MRIGIIMDENPISRCYINILKLNNVILKDIILLKEKSFLPNFISLRIHFKKNNYWPLLFLKQKNFLFLAHQIEDYFNFPRNFCREMYKFENINDVCKQIIATNSQDINSENSKNIIKQSEHDFFFNTGKQILKSIMELNKKFIHIHPGYLPEIKGADGSLWHINKHNNIGISSFFMSKKIDEGLVIAKEKFEMPKFSLKNYNELNVKTLYRLWFSLFDPLLRGWHFKKFIKEKSLFIEDSTVKNFKGNQYGQYFSFMNKAQLKETFDKVFL